MSLNQGRKVRDQAQTPIRTAMKPSIGAVPTPTTIQMKQTHYFACRCTWEGDVEGTEITCPHCGGRYHRTAHGWVKSETQP